MSLQSPPPVVPRPKLAQWMFDRDLKLRDAVREIGVKGEQVRRYCLPFGDPSRTVPPREKMERIIAWTRGEVTPDDFYPRLATEQVGPAPQREGGFSPADSSL